MNPRTTAVSRLSAGACAGIVLATSLGCISHSHVEDFSGVDGLRGEPIEYQTTTSWALHGLFVFPMWGNAKKDHTLEAFAREAADRGATRMRVTQTSSTTYWFVFPPISFFVHPVQATVEGDVEGTVQR